MRTLKHKYKKTTGWMRAELNQFCSIEIEDLPKQDAKLQKLLEQNGYEFGIEDNTVQIAR